MPDCYQVVGEARVLDKILAKQCPWFNQVGPGVSTDPPGYSTGLNVMLLCSAFSIQHGGDGSPGYNVSYNVPSYNIRNEVVY